MQSKNKEAKWDIVWWCLAGVLAVVMLLYQPSSPPATVFWLLALFGLLIYPILQLPPIRGETRTRNKLLKKAVALSIALAAVVVFGAYIWPAPKYPSLTTSQRETFVRTLREIKNPQYKIRLGCSADERVCASLTEYIEMFHEGGWVVRANAVNRGYLSKPHPGVVVVLHGSGVIPDPDDPKWGLWTRLSAERSCILRALSRAGLMKKIETEAVSNIPEDEILIVFGPESQ